MENASQTSAQIYIRIEPVADEATDMYTLALVNDVREQVLTALPREAPYTIDLLSEHKRDAGIIVVGVSLAASASAYLVANKDRIGPALLQLFQTGIKALAQQKPVTHIDIKYPDGRSISIDNPSCESEAKLVDWITQEPQLTLPATIEVTATVSQEEEEE